MTQIVFAGLRLIKGKKSFLYYNPESKDFTTFSKHLCPNDFVGAVIEVEISENGTTYRKANIVRGTNEDDSWSDDRNYWFAQSRAAQEEFDMLANAKKMKGDPIEELIKEARQSLKAVSRQDRLRIARYVFESLMW